MLGDINFKVVHIKLMKVNSNSLGKKEIKKIVMIILVQGIMMQG